LKTRAGLSVDHALRPNILLQLDGGYALSDFKAQGTTDRKDKTYEAGGGLEYFPPYAGLSFKARYDFRMRQSDAPEEDYKSNRLLFSITQSF